MTDPAEPEFHEIEVEEPTVAEVEQLPYWIVREQGVEGLSIRMVRSWVFEKVQSPETPLTAGTVQYIEMVSQLIANGIVPLKIVK